jgi:hypothetical protein
MLKHLPCGILMPCLHVITICRLLWCKQSRCRVSALGHSFPSLLPWQRSSLCTMHILCDLQHMYTEVTVDAPFAGVQNDFLASDLCHAGCSLNSTWGKRSRVACSQFRCNTVVLSEHKKGSACDKESALLPEQQMMEVAPGGLHTQSNVTK